MTASHELPFEILVPGTWLDLPSRDASFEIQVQISLIENAFAEAAMAQVLFEQARVSISSPVPRWEADLDRLAEISHETDIECGPTSNRADWEERGLNAERRLLRENWSRGMPPRTLLHRVPFILAKSFLYASDEIGKQLYQLAERPDVPAGVRRIHEAFYDSFPTLREVRNSAQHMEDRGRGLGKPGKPLRLKPIDNRMFRAPSGVLVLSALNGNRFGATMADGHYGEVEVSTDSLKAMRDHIRDLLECFPWRGPPTLFPR